jgi:imidazolonepropionase
LLTLRGARAPRRGAELNELGIICDGAVLVRDGILQEIGPTRRLENLAEARRAVEVNAAGRVVLPGFIDGHTHLPFPLPGMPVEDVEGAARVVRANSGKRLVARVRVYLEAMARHGTTTVEAKTGCGPDESAELKLLRILSTLQREPLDVIPTYLFRLPAARLGGEAADREATEWAVGDLLPKIQRRRWARFIDVACDAEPDRQPLFSCFLDRARELGFGCRIHAGRLASRAAIGLAAGPPDHEHRPPGRDFPE